ncbi:MAG: hypothetical protein DRI26_08540 [Chloroflexi bacterium]|nr:MAG: hypothetical protein DRI26_08540 [Chloroflexota bacterium]
MGRTEELLESLERRVEHLEEAVERINHELGKLYGSQHSVELLIRYVVLPLIAVVGALVGVKIALH